MDWEKLNPIVIPAAIALVSGIIGYFLKYYLDKKAQFASNNAELKREAYQKFVNLTASFFIKSKKSQKLQNNAVEELGEFYKQYVLYGSPKVVRVFANLMQVFYKREALKITDHDMTKAEQRHMIRSMTKVYKAMRKDIGLSNRLLGYGGAALMRAIITDYDVVMRPKFITWLSLFTMSFRNNLGQKAMEEKKADRPSENPSPEDGTANNVVKIQHTSKHKKGKERGR